MLEVYEAWIIAVESDLGLKIHKRCYSISRAMVRDFPELMLKRGWYTDLTGETTEHWWCVAAFGEIVDPTRSQFVDRGQGFYREVDECGRQYVSWVNSNSRGLS